MTTLTTRRAFCAGALIFGIGACTPLKDDVTNADASTPDSASQIDVSCKQIHDDRPDAPSGVYALHDGRDFNAYCEMDLWGGGWTAIFSGINGLKNRFGSFDNLVEVCPDPQTKCIQFAPPSLTTDTKMLASCGTNAITFNLRDVTGVRFFTQGRQFDWVFTTNQETVAGNADPKLVTQIWTGVPDNHGWILSANDHSPVATKNTFSSSYSYNGSSDWDYCAGKPDNVSPIHIFYR